MLWTVWKHEHKHAVDRQFLAANVCMAFLIFISTPIISHITYPTWLCEITAWIQQCTEVVLVLMEVSSNGFPKKGTGQAGRTLHTARRYADPPCQRKLKLHLSMSLSPSVTLYCARLVLPFITIAPLASSSLLLVSFLFLLHSPPHSLPFFPRRLSVPVMPCFCARYTSLFAPTIVLLPDALRDIV